jgi:hypothetical protein
MNRVSAVFPTSYLRHQSVLQPVRQRLGWAVLIILAAVVAADADETIVESKPSLDDIQRFAIRYFEKQPGYQSGDLVTRSTATKLLKALQEKGWQVANREELLDRVLADDDFLVRQFSDEKGREFLHKITNLPEGIDRVDRLRRLPQGELSVNDLIRKVPNGAEWIEGMTTTTRGEILGQRLSNAPDGHDFNEPTRRIYTVPDLAREISQRLEPAKDSAVGRNSSAN